MKMKSAGAAISVANWIWCAPLHARPRRNFLLRRLAQNARVCLDHSFLSTRTDREMIPSVESMVVHEAHATCRVPAAVAFRFLGDGRSLGRWALGSWGTEDLGGGVFRGHSLFDDQPAYIRLESVAAEMRVYYHVGSSPTALAKRIEAHVFEDGEDPSVCRIMLRAARPPEMNDERWTRLVRCHEVEVMLIQARVERCFGLGMLEQAVVGES